MSDVLAPITLLPSGFLACGSVAKFVPAVRGVDVTTCGWPVVIGFMCATAVLRGAGMCCACDLATPGLRCCNWPAMMGFPACAAALRMSTCGCVLSLLVVSCETTLLNVMWGACCFACAVGAVTGLIFCGWPAAVGLPGADVALQGEALAVFG